MNRALASEIDPVEGEQDKEQVQNEEKEKDNTDTSSLLNK
jgi:hypothetical protein